MGKLPVKEVIKEESEPHTTAEIERTDKKISKTKFRGRAKSRLTLDIKLPGVHLRLLTEDNWMICAIVFIILLFSLFKAF